MFRVTSLLGARFQELLLEGNPLLTRLHCGWTHQDVSRTLPGISFRGTIPSGSVPLWGVHANCATLFVGGQEHGPQTLSEAEHKAIIHKQRNEFDARVLVPCKILSISSRVRMQVWRLCNCLTLLLCPACFARTKSSSSLCRRWFARVGPW